MARSALLAVTILTLGLPLPGCYQNPSPRAPDGPTATANRSALDASELSGRSVSRVEEMLVGRFPGVRVIPTAGGGFAVRIWGATSLPGQRDPLYVVDGVPVQVAPGQGLDWLNPEDVRSIRVLKNVSETSPYGMRGMYGVVVITTRRGGGPGGR